jgi:cytochrome c-type biogenesis protein CcmE
MIRAQSLKRKNQRLILLVMAGVAMLGAVLLAMAAMRDQASFFYAPGDVVRRGLPLDRAVRIGGMVRQGSIQRHPDGVTIDFMVGDDSAATIPVRFTGITPELFRENSGVVAEGRFQADGRFMATEILARHDENYMPPRLGPQGDRHETDTLK